jgi:hypothetical protein
MKRAPTAISTLGRFTRGPNSAFARGAEGGQSASSRQEQAEEQPDGGQIWMATCVGDVLASMPRLDEPNLRESLCEKLNALVRDVAAGNLRAFCDLTGSPKVRKTNFSPLSQGLSELWGYSTDRENAPACDPPFGTIRCADDWRWAFVRAPLSLGNPSRNSRFRRPHDNNGSACRPGAGAAGARPPSQDGPLPG